MSGPWPWPNPNDEQLVAFERRLSAVESALRDANNLESRIAALEHASAPSGEAVDDWVPNAPNTNWNEPCGGCPHRKGSHVFESPHRCTDCDCRSFTPASPAPELVCANQDCGHKQGEHYSGECWGSPRCYCSAFISAPPAPEPDPVLLAISEVYRCLVDQEYPENDTLLRLRNAWRCCHGISLMRSVDVEPEIMAYGVKS